MKTHAGKELTFQARNVVDTAWQAWSSDFHAENHVKLGTVVHTCNSNVEDQKFKGILSYMGSLG